ncbi:hypothetical protein H109_04305 [Trichophyton interdigitale MR816]|uniref:Uncharacterized protein n=1 Tax=Trichophyton interdigitale (strain MR816) TaxID=1215338 RepID=A0A059J7J3_TRIIM|nr:hypothetical protein H109_04305 [Trichophyton interdigitale MR816]
MFPTPPPTRSLGSRQREGSSGDGSMGSAGSRISSQDAFRMGGPGLLPSWPVQMGVSEGLSEQFRERLMNLALEYLGKYQLSYHRLMVVRRYSEGLIPSPADNTLYISLYTPSNDNWVKALDDILSAIEPLQFTGRVEMIDHRALGGMKTFPPDTPDQLVQEWEQIQSTIIRCLDSIQINWKAVMLLKRGYWEEVAVNTIVVKASIPSRALAISTRDQVAFDVDSIFERFSLQVDVVRSDLMWGLFSEKQATDSVNASLGWPFTNVYNLMGISIARADTPDKTGTLGGYFCFTDAAGCEQFLGLTCYHVIGSGPDGEVDSLIQQNQSNNINFPCQSPSGSDIQAAIAYTTQKMDSCSANTEGESEEHRELSRQTIEAGERELNEIRSFNPNIGTVVATSSLRNISLHSTVESHLNLMDWALVHIKNGRKSFNYIAETAPVATPLWKPGNNLAISGAPIPKSQDLVVKKGRTTGATSGILDGLVPAALRISSFPVGVHRRGWVVVNKDMHFAKNGDSGAWVLNMSGQVVGMVFAGDKADGTALIAPMDLIVEDIEDKVGIPRGSLRLKN